MRRFLQHSLQFARLRNYKGDQRFAGKSGGNPVWQGRDFSKTSMILAEPRDSLCIAEAQICMQARTSSRKASYLSSPCRRHSHWSEPWSRPAALAVQVFIAWCLDQACRQVCPVIVSPSENELSMKSEIQSCFLRFTFARLRKREGEHRHA